MKKLFLIIFSLVLCGYCFSEEPASEAEKAEKAEKTQKFRFGFDTGILSPYISYENGNTFAFNLNANLANFYIENIKTGLGAEFFPINYSYSVNNNEHTLSFSKLTLYWNLDKFMKKSEKDTIFTFGPFVSMQTLNLVNFENFNTNISYSAGIKLAHKFEVCNGVTYLSTNVELGYNYFNNKHSIYFTLGWSPACYIAGSIAYLLGPFMFFW